MQINIHSIVQIYPDFEEKIERLFLTNANFREVCKDYIFCASFVLDLKKEMDKNKEQIDEYEDIQLHLEQEILKIISKQDKSNEL
jgi:hypothetical protein